MKTMQNAEFIMQNDLKCRIHNAECIIVKVRQVQSRHPERGQLTVEN